MRFQFSGTPQKRGFGCACVLCLPRPERLRQPEAWAPSPRVRCAFSLRGPSARCRSGACGGVCFQELASSRDPPGGGCRPSRISGSLWIETGGLFAVWEGVSSLGPSLPLSPPPCLQLGWASSSLEFLSPFVLQTTGSVFGPVNFSLLSHSLKSSLQLLSGPSGRSLP